MCGIVGYVGKRNAQDVLLDGLEKLEYRGYDSAGVALALDGGIRVVKSKGRLTALREKLAAQQLAQSFCGIGHTRWATHGEPSDVNSHPHSTPRVSIVHNGIIENYGLLKERLAAKGYTFQSETDTEVLVKLIDSCYTGDPLRALQQALAKVRGSYALAVLFIMPTLFLVLMAGAMSNYLQDKPPTLHLVLQASPSGAYEQVFRAALAAQLPGSELLAQGDARSARINLPTDFSETLLDDEQQGLALSFPPQLDKLSRQHLRGAMRIALAQTRLVHQLIRQLQNRPGVAAQQFKLQLANRHAALSAGDLPQVQCHLDHTAIAPAHRPGRAFKCRGKARLQRGKHRALGVQALPGGRGLQSGLHQRGPRHRHLPLTTQAQCGITAVAGLEGLQPLRRVIPAHPAQAQGHALGAQGLRGCVEVDVVHLLAHGLAARQRWQTRQLTGQASGVGRGQGQLDFKLCTRAVLAGRGHGVCLARSRRHGEGPLPEMSAGSRHAP